MERRLAVLGLGLAALFANGCSPAPASARLASGEASPPAAATGTTPAATVKAAPTVTAISVSDPARGKASPPPASAQAQVTPAPLPAPLPAPFLPPPSPAARESTPAPPAAASGAPIAIDIGGLVEVDPVKPGLTRIGSDKCKLCHSVQFKSWAGTAHAARTPPLDCESCHGAGSEYKSMAIMKDAKKARAAGMVTPVRSFCARCHTTGWTDDLLRKAHAHKAGA